MLVLHNQTAALRISGADANTYLQGQFSNDLSGVVGLVRYGLWLDHKGRVQADGHLLKLAENDWLCFSDSATGEQLARHLNRSIIADEVDVRDETPLWRSAVAWGPELEEIFPHLKSNPPLPDRFAERDGTIVIRSRVPQPCSVRFFFPVAAAAGFVEQLQQAAGPAAAAVEFERVRIRHGVAVVPQDIGPADLPQEGGLELEAISFTKGCFLGQEVMARLNNRGRLRRRLHPVRGPGTAPPPGTPLFQDGKKAGEIRSSAPDDTGYLALAMLTLAGLDPARPLSPAPGGPADIEILRHE